MRKNIDTIGIDTQLINFGLFGTGTEVYFDKNVTFQQGITVNEVIALQSANIEGSGYCLIDVGSIGTVRTNELFESDTGTGIKIGLTKLSFYDNIPIAQQTLPGIGTTLEETQSALQDVMDFLRNLGLASPV